ncbi:MULTISPECIES: TetR/AcrR family transcriptional regulator [unclassified Gordonia (in: high G+C Gram-positive bacteria)]|uniref:TetR/AcrR family transcriptional regulator n=1 Tax=unclassified Gordonia (in: high G+C Gram-positive bacteria) TaxID=2657482 RepID=UPI001FFF172B|nr:MULTISPECIES: TetR/AcrR family transcriptional regulator [unclassified Gordonia (in: high G+C Gram-positive bacteria)]UQE73715.1 TetR/AcrR family transcriptional regulator [Gordonia sp. PP30]
MQETTTSPREQKRAETLRRIHDAAVELTLRDGLAAATVSDIAERAGVSRRTFFNYFPTKEDAVLGISEPRIPPHALESFLHPAPPAGDDAGADRFAQALELTVTTLASVGPRPSQDIAVIVGRYPELINRIRSHRDATQQLLVDALTERLAQQHSPASAADSARALILLSGAVLRFAHGDDPGPFDDPDPAAVKNAMTAFRNALKDLA